MSSKESTEPHNANLAPLSDDEISATDMGALAIQLLGGPHEPESPDAIQPPSGSSEPSAPVLSRDEYTRALDEDGSSFD